MASLVLNGNTSGSVTISSPAVSGTTTITLPTVSGGNFLVSDSSGNVGIGTISPTQRLQVDSTSATSTVFSRNGGTNANTNVQFKNSTTSFYLGTNTSGNFAIKYNDPDLATSPNMVIDSSGKVGIGMSPTDPLTIQCSSQTFGGGLGFKLSGGANNWGIVVGGDAKLYLGYSATTTPSAVGNFATNGTYTATSDIRKKKDITYTFNGLEIVNALKPAQGRMLEDDDTSPLRPMFIAQDMVDVIPALVSNLEPEPSDDPLLGVDYASITPILVKAIQEQQTIIETLKADIAELKAKVNV